MPKVLKTEKLRIILENVNTIPTDNEKGHIVYLLPGSHPYINTGD